jgi:hypothetical protein
MSALVQHGIKGMDKLRQQLRDYPRFMRTQEAALLRKHARALISSSGANKGLVQIIPPASMDRGVFGTPAKKQGEAKVMGDIWKVYGTPGDIYKMLKAKNAQVAKGYWQAMKRRDWAACNGIARRLGVPVLVDFTSDDGAEHKRRRRNGVVTGKQKTLYVTDARYVRAYIKMKQRNVGLLAAALVNNYSGQFGALAGVAAWVSRHSGSWGSAQIENYNHGAGNRVRISLSGGALNRDMQRWFNAALRFRVIVMQREAPYALRAAAKSAGLLK